MSEGFCLLQAVEDSLALVLEWPGDNLREKNVQQSEAWISPAQGSGESVEMSTLQGSESQCERHCSNEQFGVASNALRNNPLSRGHIAKNADQNDVSFNNSEESSLEYGVNSEGIGAAQHQTCGNYAEMNYLYA